MKRNSCVVKASNIYYLNLSQPDRLYQIAEEYYQRAQACELDFSFQKAKVHYQKAEEYYQRARDAYKARKQADKAKKQAGEARKQADEARKQAGEAGKPEVHNGGWQHRPVFLPVIPQPQTRQQPPEPKQQAPQPALAKTTARMPRPSQKETPKKAVNHSIECTTELPLQPPSEIQDTPIAPEKNVNRPISWKGKRHG
jgi:hypothetical protein